MGVTGATYFGVIKLIGGEYSVVDGVNDSEPMMFWHYLSEVRVFIHCSQFCFTTDILL